MHELSIVLEIFDLLDEIVIERELKAVTSVTVEAGELCGVLPDYFTECWNVARIGGSYENTELILEKIPAVAKCTCGAEYEMTKCSRVCPACGKTDYKVVSGRQFNVKQIEAT